MKKQFLIFAVILCILLMGCNQSDTSKVKTSEPTNEFGCFTLAGVEGFEPPRTVLETAILPLYDSPMKLSGIEPPNCIIA